jgi:hypothetical protein
MEEFGSLVVGLALLILLAVTSMRFGVDSRDGLRSRRDAFTPLGIVWDVPSAAPRPLKPVQEESAPPLPAPADCGLTPCPA